VVDETNKKDRYDLLCMELAVSTLHLLDKPLEEALPGLITLGISNVEIADSGNHSLNPKRVSRLQEIRSSYNLKFSIHAPYADTNLSADDDLIREWILKRIRATIRFANELDAKSVVIHPGWTTATDRFMKGRAWKLNLRSVHWLLRYAEEYGIPLLMENVPEPTPYLLVRVEDFEMFFEEMDFWIGMVLDVGHSNLLNETYDFLSRFKDRIKHIHISDNNGVRDQHLAIGDGEINWKGTMEAISDSGFSDWVVIESYNGIKESLEYLKKFF